MRSVRTVAAIGVSASLGLTAIAAHAGLVSPAQSTPHDRQFWRQIIESDFAVPEGASACELIVELNELLGSPDTEMRDRFGFEIPWAWIIRDDRLSPVELRRLLRLWSDNLQVGLGDVGMDSVLLRSFSALSLSLVAARDMLRPFLEADEVAAFLSTALTYFDEERDLRGFDDERGWLHSVAHGADVIKFLARSPHLRRGDQQRILESLTAKLAGGGVYAHREDERLAEVVVSLLRRSDLDADAFDAWLADVSDAGRRRRAAPKATSRLLAVEQNSRHLLSSMFVILSTEESLSPREQRARDQIRVCGVSLMWTT